MAPHREPLIFYFLSKMTKKTEKEGCFTAQQGTFIFVFFGQQGLGLRPNQLFKKKNFTVCPRKAFDPKKLKLNLKIFFF